MNNQFLCLVVDVPQMLQLSDGPARQELEQLLAVCPRLTPCPDAPGFLAVRLRDLTPGERRPDRDVVSIRSVEGKVPSVILALSEEQLTSGTVFRLQELQELYCWRN